MMRTLIAAALAASRTTAWAAEARLKLENAAGVQQVYSNCISCRSVDYIQANSPFLDHKRWQAEVTKMINVYGAPAKAEDVPIIIDHLATTYGKQ